ncbi:hypothetical protein M422DRAFT_265391 [Sphaerobolus stellatus SS14]|uniref:Uncharacterized protein n=1 Tax=Sphaerobolus stellatus (strain SS14) TaxID=990650 RepID=A0A0C9UDG8_SPHS4|nr:hypothetical protein M422DRAFT_265391 [Sphaerobolus stellatus SS14]
MYWEPRSPLPSRICSFARGYHTGQRWSTLLFSRSEACSGNSGFHRPRKQDTIRESSERLFVPQEQAMQPFLPSEFPITRLIDINAQHLARCHQYPPCTLEDLSDEELSTRLDPISQEVSRHLIQSDAANNALKVALACRDYTTLTSYVIGQLVRFKAILAEVQLLRAAHYMRLAEEDYRQEESLIKTFSKEEGTRLYREVPPRARTEYNFNISAIWYE